MFSGIRTRKVAIPTAPLWFPLLLPPFLLPEILRLPGVGDELLLLDLKTHIILGRIKVNHFNLNRRMGYFVVQGFRLDRRLPSVAYFQGRKILGMFAVRYSPFAKMRPGPISLVCDGKCMRSNTIIAVGPKDLEWSSLKQGEDVQRKQKDDGLSLSLQLE